MKQTVLAIALLGMGTGVSCAAPADLAKGLAAYEAGRCDEAVRIFKPAAEAGNADAQIALGDLYQDNDHNCETERDMRAAETWYLKAARSGDVEAQHKLITIYDYSSNMKNQEQAVFWLAKAAALGDAGDLSSLARHYEQAEGVQRDRTLAHAFYLLANQRRKQDAQKDLPKTLEYSAQRMSPEQLAEAESIAAAWKEGTALPSVSTTGGRDPLDWYVAAAKAGDLDAAYKAGTMYLKGGEGLKVQPEQAAIWLNKAAQSGNADAQYELGQLYAMGYGVPKDLVLAFSLERLASKGGSKKAKGETDGWEDVLTAEQLSEGTALIANWKKGDAFPQASRYGMQRKINYVEDEQGKLAPTPTVLALFKAASEGEEAEFARQLAKVNNINDYLVDGNQLLHALLLPAASLRKEAAAWRAARNDPRDTEHWHAQQARHAALLPAKTRMLALALKRGASLNEGSKDDHAAPLHLAAMFGTPEMVELLLKHGADPRQYGGMFAGQTARLAPLEFSVEQEQHGRGLPELITPEQRTGNMLALLKAGAERPYIRFDINRKRQKSAGAKEERPFADHLFWPKVLGLTRGTAVLDALLKTGTSPADSEQGKSDFEYAAEVGNDKAIAWLKPRLQRYGDNKRDHWLDAAMLAMYSAAPARDKMLEQLLVKDMNWSQEGPNTEGTGRDYVPLAAGSERVESGTLLNHATRARRLEWLPRLAALSAPVKKGGSARDLQAAVRDHDIKAVKALLEQGADPLAGFETSALSVALAAPAGDDAMLDLLLDHVMTMPKNSMEKLSPTPLEDILTAKSGINMPRLRKLLDAGAPLRGLSANAVSIAFTSPDRELVPLLFKHGLLDDTASGDPAFAGLPRFLHAAIAEGRVDLLPAILAHGEDPNRRLTLGSRAQANPVENTIAIGNVDALKVLVAHGGVIDTTTVRDWGTALERAIVSLNPDMLRLVSKDFSLPLKPVCFPLNGQLAKVVLESPASYWDLLREHGLFTGSACLGIQQKFVRYLAETPDRSLAGWRGDNLVQRLPQLGPARENFDAGTWSAIAVSKNAPLAGLLAKAGWAAPASAKVTANAAPQ